MIQLEKINITEEGVIRYRSQLSKKDTADFIFKNGKMYNWSYGSKGVDFYEFTGQYEIVDKIYKQKL